MTCALCALYITNIMMFFSTYSAFVAADVLSSCWESAGPAGPAGGLSGLQEKTTSQTAHGPRPDSRSVLTFSIHTSIQGILCS